MRPKRTIIPPIKLPKDISDILFIVVFIPIAISGKLVIMPNIIPKTKILMPNFLPRIFIL